MVPVVVGALQVNCYLAWGPGRQALIVDPGGDPETIAAVLDREGLTAAAYVLTHGHTDHIGALADLSAWRPAPIALHPRDLAWAFSPANEFPPFCTVPRRPEAEIGRRLEQDAEWADGGLRWRVIETPGHTPGSVCLLLPQHGILFSGDTLFAGSVGRTDLPGGDARALAASLAGLASLPDHTVVYPGHGPATDIATEKRTNFFLQRL